MTNTIAPHDFPYSKDPEEILDYPIDWAPFLGDDTIAASSWVIDDDLTSELESFTDTTTTIFVGGGISGSIYTIKNIIDTDGGRRLVRRARLTIGER